MTQIEKRTCKSYFLSINELASDRTRKYWVSDFRFKNIFLKIQNQTKCCWAAHALCAEKENILFVQNIKKEM